MNYRHAFHAGGFADVIKHIVLVRILLYLHEKPAAFRVLDTHAGAGRYDLTSEEARRGGEWLTGIARIMQARFSEKTLSLLKPYLDVVRAFNPQGALTAYQGSPLIARALLRPHARLTACEVEPDALKHQIDGLRRDTQARVVDLDGWMTLPAFVPPNERRGLVLVDPPFEARDEFERTATGLEAAFAKWTTGSYLLWYPAKSRRAADGLAQHVAATAATTTGGGTGLLPAANVRSAATRYARSSGAVRGRSFPMAMTGTVKFFNGERGYGFIKPDDGGRDVFVHITAVERAGLKDLTEGQRITFEVEPDKKGKGPKAVNLVISS